MQPPDPYCCVTPGIDHLLDGHHLPERSEWTQDRRVACFMGLLSVFSSAHEVLRIAPLPRARTHNAVSQCALTATYRSCYILPAHPEGTNNFKLDSASVCGAGIERPMI